MQKMNLRCLFHLNETTNVFFMIFPDFLLTKYHKSLHVYTSLRTGVAFLQISHVKNNT